MRMQKLLALILIFSALPASAILTPGGGGGGGGGSPTGPAGGALAGSYPNPTLADAPVLIAGSTMTGDLGLNYTGITTNTVPVINASRQVRSSSVTTTELGYLVGTTALIQTQLNARALAADLANYLALAGGTMSGDLTLDSAIPTIQSTTGKRLDITGGTGVRATVVGVTTNPIGMDMFPAVTGADVNTQIGLAFEGTTSAAVPLRASRNRNGQVSTQSHNPNAGASAYADFQSLTDAGNAYLRLQSAAGGAYATLGGSAGVTGGVRVDFAGLNALTVPYLDTNKQLLSSTVTPTELGYLAGATANIQTQLNAKAATPVDLDSAEVTGILPIGNGGTGNSSMGAFGSMPYHGPAGFLDVDYDGMHYDYTNRGLVAGQLSSTLIDDATSKTSLRINGTLTGVTAIGYDAIVVEPTLSGNFNGFRPGLAVFPTISGVTTAANIQTVEFGAVYTGANSASSVTDFNIHPNFSANTGDIGPYKGIGFNATFNDHSSVAVLDSNNIIGVTSNIQNYSGIDVHDQFLAGATVDNVTGIRSAPSFQVGSVMTNYVGIEDSPTINGAVSSYSGIKVSPNGTITTPQPKALDLQTNNLYSSTPFTRPAGYNHDGRGIFNHSVQVTVFNNHPSVVDTVNFMNTLVGVSAGSPVTGSGVLGLNTPLLIDAQDDIDLDPAGIGLVSAGYVNVFGALAGVTVAELSGAVGVVTNAVGFNGSTGGHLGKFNAFKTPGVFPSGGTNTFGDLNGYTVNNGFCSAALGTCRGVSIEDSTAKLFVAGLTADRALVSDASQNVSSSSVTATELGYLSGATANIQTQINAAIAGTGFVAKTGDSMSGALDVGANVTSTGTVQGANLLATSATASRFAMFDGSKNVVSSANAVTDTEFGYLLGATAGIQTQLNAKAESSALAGYLPLTGGSLSGALDVGATVTATTLNATGLTANRAMATDASKNLVTTAVTDTELGYVSGVTAALQTQLNAKLVAADIAGKLDKAGGSMSGALDVGANITSTNTIAGATVNVSSLTAGTALISDGSKNIASSSVTSTELANLSGTTSAVQTQLNAKISRTGDSMSGPLEMADGSAAVPSVSFSGSPDTGIYRTGLGNVGVSVDNSTVFIAGVTAVTANQPLVGTQGIAVVRTNIASAATLASADCSTGFINLTGTTATTLAGIAVPDNGTANLGTLCYVVNLTGQNMTIAHQSGSAGAAAERIITNTGADIVSTGNSTATFIYSQFEPRWILLNAEL